MFREIKLIYRAMLCDENWIPFENIDERDLVAELVATKRSFVKGLRFNVGDRPLASILLSDVTPPVAMYVLANPGDEHDHEAIHQMTADNNLGLWIWRWEQERGRRYRKGSESIGR